METDNSPSQQPAPRQPQPGMRPRPVQPMGHRPMIDGFAPRRPTTPPNTHVRRPTPDIGAPAQPQAQPRPFATRPAGVQAPAPSVTLAARTAPTSQHFAQVPQSQQPRPFATRSVPMDGAVRSADPQTSAPTSDSDMSPASKARAPKEHNSTGHAGFVGLATFVVLGGLLLSPIIPGKISQSFPLSSSTFSTGDQTLDCLGTQSNVSTATKYDSKAGAPITYEYSTSTSQSAECSGQEQTAVIGHTSQFNPLGLVLDIVVALAVAIIVTRVWRLIFGERRYKPHKREEK